jgi:hypothetical protein
MAEIVAEEKAEGERFGGQGLQLEGHGRSFPDDDANQVCAAITVALSLCLELFLQLFLEEGRDPDPHHHHQPLSIYNHGVARAQSG